MVLLRHVLALAGLVVSVTASASRPAPDHRRRGSIRRDGSLDGTLIDSNSTVIHGVFMVELHGGISAADLENELKAEGITIQTRRVFDSKLFKGVSFDRAWPVRKVTAPDDKVVATFNMTDSLSPQSRLNVAESYNPHVMTQVDLLHKAGFTGKGVRIGVIDSGINYDHPILGGCFGPGCLVTYGWDSIGVDYLDDAPQGPEPDDDPKDCSGHGTHVAGILAARPNDFGFIGVAPDAELGAYRVLDCMGGGTEETVLDGMLRAFDDGSDIITMSLGTIGGYPETVISQTTTRIIEAGVPVFVSVGNDGEYWPMFEPGSPADGHLVSSVASFNPDLDPTVLAVAEYIVGDEDASEFAWLPGWLYVGEDVNEWTFPVIDINSFVYDDNSTVTGCDPLPASVPDLTGYLVLAQRSEGPDCYEWNQQDNMQVKGAMSYMFWAPGELPEEAAANGPDTNVGSIPESMAKRWREALADGSNITATLTIPHMSMPTVVLTSNEETGGLVSDFSSWGPNWDLRSAPSFGAPGHNILSTYRLGWGRVGELAVLSGTSMSTPLVAGAAALLSQVRGTLDPATLHNLLSSTAKQVPFFQHERDARGLAPAMQAGGGLIQVWDAAQAKGVLSIASISFNDSDYHVGEVTFTLLNTGDDEATYALGQTAASTIYAWEPGMTKRLSWGSYDSAEATATITFAADEISVGPGATVEITLRCTAPQRVDESRWPLYSGYITLNGTNGDNLVVPYVGNAGSMHDDGLVIDSELSYLTSGGGGGWDIGYPIEADKLFTVPQPGNEPTELDLWEDEVPIAYAQVETRTRSLRVDLIPAATPPNGTIPGNGTHPSDGTSRCHLPRETWLGHKTYGQIWGSPYVNTSPGPPYLLGFAGFLADQTHVQPGRYSFLVSALRAFSDPQSNKTEDWQTVKTVPFVLRYED